MVNDTTEKKKFIINILGRSTVPVSGEELALAIGASRVAVWKIISGLKESGYDIESTHSGYRLISSTDKPLPWEMGEVAGKIEYHTILDSTMHKASKLIDSGCENGTVIIAGTQTAGLSSDGRTWTSPDGGLYLTRIRTKSFPSVYSGLYSISIAAAAVRVLREIYNIRAFIDWPGGIIVEEAKLGGVLIEFRGKNNIITATASGIGLNLGSARTLPDGAAAMTQFTEKKVSAKKITSELLDAIESQDESFYSKECINEYQGLIIQLGRKISLNKLDCKASKGSITSLHYSGSLLLETEDGRIKHIFSGDQINYE